MDWRNWHIDAALTGFALAYRPEGFIADTICPRVTVDKASGKYYIFGTEHMKLRDTYRADKTPSKMMEITMSTDSFECNAHALSMAVDNKDRAMAAGWSPDIVAVQALMDNMYLSLEYEVAALATSTSSYASSSYYTTLSGTDQWNDTGGSSDPHTQIMDAVTTVKNGCGVAPNSIIIPYEVAIKLGKHPQLVDIQKYTTNLIATVGLPPVLWGLRVIVAGAQKDATREGQSGNSFSSLWSDYVIVAYVEPNTNWMSMAWMKNFTFAPEQLPFFVQRIPQPELGNNCEKIEVNESGRCPKVVCNKAAYLFIDTLA